MSDAHTTTSPLPRAEQALLVLKRFLRSAELLSEYYTGSKFKSSIVFLIDLIKLAISLIQTIQTDPVAEIKSLTATSTELGHRFGKLTPFKQQTVMEMIIQLLKLWATEGER